MFVVLRYTHVSTKDCINMSKHSCVVLFSGIFHINTGYEEIFLVLLVCCTRRNKHHSSNDQSCDFNVLIDIFFFIKT